MPITSTRAVSDPYAPLSWSTSLLLVALRKIRLGRRVEPAESEAIKHVLKELHLLSEASRIALEKGSIAIPSHLRRSFCTLVALRERPVHSFTPPRFDEVGQDLEIIEKNVDSDTTNAIPTDVLERARSICLDLLENLNKQRPNAARL